MKTSSLLRPGNIRGAWGRLFGTAFLCQVKVIGVFTREEQQQKCRGGPGRLIHGKSLKYLLTDGENEFAGDLEPSKARIRFHTSLISPDTSWAMS